MPLFGRKKEKRGENDSELPKLEGSEFPSFPELPKETDESMFQMPPVQLKTIPMLPQRQQPMLMELPPIRPMVEEIRYAGAGFAEDKFKEPIFVKIDKFRDALNILESIKKKLKV